MLSDTEVVTLINSEINNALGYDDDQTTQNRAEAYQYFYGENRSDDVVGNSQVQSLDVADMVEAVMSNMMPAFSGDTLVMFEAEGDDDTRQAVIESEVCNNQIMERNPGFWNISQSVKDALLLRNGIMKADVLETEAVTTMRLESVDDVTIGLAMQIAEQNQTKSMSNLKELKDDLYDVTITTVTTTRKLEVDTVDPTRFLINANHDSVYLDDARFISEIDYPTRTELIDQGFNEAMVNELPAYSTVTRIDALARSRSYNADVNERGSQSDRSMEEVERFTSYFRYDRDQDGVAELHRCVSVGNELLSDDLVDYQIYATGCCFVNPHQYQGISLFDKLRNIQDIKTKTLRQWLDNLDSNNHLTTVVADGSVNLDDIKSTRPGKIVRARSPEAVREMPIADLGSSSAALLSYADKMRSERGGASLDLQGAELQLAGETAHGVERQMGSKEQLAALMCRNLSETLIRSIYLLVHRTLRTKMPGEIVTRIGKEFVNIDPMTWQTRERVNVKAGLSVQERAHKKRVMEQILAKQTELFQSGMDGVLVDMESYHNALNDWGRASLIDNPERYFIDPKSKKAEAAAQQKQQEQQAAQAKEKEMNEMIFGVANQMEQMKIQLDKYKHDQDLQFDYYKAALDADLKEADMIVNNRMEMEKLDANQSTTTN